MNKSAAIVGVAIAAISLSVGLVGCGKDSKTSTTSTSTTTSPTTTSAAATTSAQASGPAQTLEEYLQANNIQATVVTHGTPGAPAIDLPVPEGWSQLPESEDAPYGGISYDAPSDPASPVAFKARLSKLTGKIDTDKLLVASVGELKNQQGFDGGDGEKSTLSGFPAYQILGSYTKNGAQRVGAEKTAVIQGADGIYLLEIAGSGPEADAQAIQNATNVIDEKTTITP